jgi:hypothetical protein
VEIVARANRQAHHQALLSAAICAFSRDAGPFLIIQNPKPLCKNIFLHCFFENTGFDENAFDVFLLSRSVVELACVGQGKLTTSSLFTLLLWTKIIFVGTRHRHNHSKRYHQ